MAAAPADFRPERRAERQDRARGAAASSSASSRPRTSSPASAARSGEGQTWSASRPRHGAGGVERAREKLAARALDAIVVNDVSRPEIGFESERNEVTWSRRAASTQLPIAPKEEVAEAILDRVEALRSAGAEAGLSPSSARPRPNTGAA